MTSDTTTTTKATTKTTTMTISMSINGGDDDVDNGGDKDIDDSAMTMTCNVAFWLAGETKRNSYPYVFILCEKGELMRSTVRPYARP